MVGAVQYHRRRLHWYFGKELAITRPTPMEWTSMLCFCCWRFLQKAASVPGEVPWYILAVSWKISYNFLCTLLPFPAHSHRFSGFMIRLHANSSHSYPTLYQTQRSTARCYGWDQSAANLLLPLVLGFWILGKVCCCPCCKKLFQCWVFKHIYQLIYCCLSFQEGGCFETLHGKVDAEDDGCVYL